MQWLEQFGSQLFARHPFPDDVSLVSSGLLTFLENLAILQAHVRSTVVVPVEIDPETLTLVAEVAQLIRRGQIRGTWHEFSIALENTSADAGEIIESCNWTRTHTTLVRFMRLRLPQCWLTINPKTASRSVSLLVTTTPSFADLGRSPGNSLTVIYPSNPLMRIMRRAPGLGVLLLPRLLSYPVNQVARCSESGKRTLYEVGIPRLIRLFLRLHLHPGFDDDVLTADVSHEIWHTNRQVWVGFHRHVAQQEKLMKQELPVCAPEIVTVSPKARPQLQLMGQWVRDEPAFHLVSDLVPVRAGDPVEKLEYSLRTRTRRSVGPTDVIEKAHDLPEPPNPHGVSYAMCPRPSFSRDGVILHAALMNRGRRFDCC